jgi:hypothetical protein
MMKMNCLTSDQSRTEYIFGDKALRRQIASARERA